MQCARGSQPQISPPHRATRPTVELLLSVAMALPNTRTMSSSLQGYCYNGSCLKLPIVIGEFGGYLRDCRNRCASANPNCMTLELNVRLCCSEQHPHLAVQWSLLVIIAVLSHCDVSPYA